MIILVLYSQEALDLSVIQHRLLLIAGAVVGVVGGLFPKIAALLERRRALQSVLLGLAVSNALLALVPSVLIVVMVLIRKSLWR